MSRSASSSDSGLRRRVAPVSAPPTRQRAARAVDHNALARRVASRRSGESVRRRARAADRLGQQWSREREELMASISHELRTPLTSVVGFTEVLLSGDAGILNEEQAALLQRVASNGDRLLALIEGLLSASSERMARCEAGDAVDVADVIFEVVGQAQSATDARPRRTRPKACLG